MKRLLSGKIDQFNQQNYGYFPEISMMTLNQHYL